MKRKINWQIILKIILCGLLYEVFYRIALALLWGTTREIYSFIVAVAAGIIIALIIRRGEALKTFVATIGGLVSAFVFTVISTRLGIPWKMLVYFLPYMEEIGHTTINEDITVGLLLLDI